MTLRAIQLAAALALGGQLPGLMNLFEPPETGDARIELAFDKPAYELGETVLLHYCIANVSKRPFSVALGGDSRGASRSTRFKVTVTNALGVAMPDPDPSGYHEGGALTTPQIVPGGRECRSLLLMRYARIDEAGSYSIRATHDLGWKATRPPEGQATVTLSMPTVDDARRIVATTLTMPSIEDYALGTMQIRTPRRDFTVLRYPVYLAPLVRLAESGNVEAMAGIGSIPTLDATRALTSLMRHQNRDVAREASRELAGRLPDPALEGRLPRRSAFGNDVEGPRKYMRDAAWRSELAPEVRRVAAEWLASDDASLVVQAAFMIEAVGGVEDAPALSGALDRALERTLTLPFEKGGYPRPRGAIQELLRAADVLVTLGYSPPPSPPTAGDAALWLTAFGKGARPQNWQATMRTLLGHRLPYVRELTLNWLPESAPPDLLAAVGPALQHTDVDLQIAALKTVARLKLTEHRQQASALCRQANDTMFQSFACNAVYATAGRVALYEIMLARLAEPDLFDSSMSSLFGALQVGGWGNGPVSDDEKAALIARWRAFLDTHRTELEAGKRFALDDPAVAGLVPSRWQVRPPGK